MRPTPPRPNINISRTSRLPVRPVNRIISSRSIIPTTIQVRPTRIISSRSISSNTIPERGTDRIISSRSITLHDRSISSNQESQNTESQEISINIENNNSPPLSSPRPSIISSRQTNRYIEYRSNSQSPYMVNSETIVNNLSPLRLERFRSPLSSFNFNIVNTYENNQENSNNIEDISSDESSVENNRSDEISTIEDEIESDESSNNSLIVETDIDSEDEINIEEINLNELNLSIYKYYKDDNCPICISSMENMEIINLGCLHKFHKDCLLKWWEYDKNNSSCPLCRTQNYIPS